MVQVPNTYLLFYKPYGVLSSFTDPEGRPVLKDYIPIPRVYEAGRLDFDSEGLMLLTDDGELAHRMAHPQHHQPKTYLAQVEGIPAPDALAALRRGVPLKGEMTAPAEAELLSAEPAVPPRPVSIRYRANIPTSWLRIVLREGRKRQVRHMTAAVGHPTLRLVRVGIGPLALGDLQPGQWRHLTSEEVAELKRVVGLTATATQRTKSTRAPTGGDR
jgi:23S rRNA pseudouridine2457 synthase